MKLGNVCLQSNLAKPPDTKIEEIKNQKKLIAVTK